MELSKIYTDNDFKNAVVPAGQLLTFAALDSNGKVITRYKDSNGAFGTLSGGGGGLDTSDATATAEDILLGKTAYAQGEKLTGTASADAEDVKAGVTLLNVTGTFTADATATASDIATGKTAYVNGEKLTGTMSGGGGEALAVWQNIESRIFPAVSNVTIMQTPSNKYQNFFVADGKLMLIPQDMKEVRILFPELNWSYARTRQYSYNNQAYAISNGKMYHIYQDTSLPPPYYTYICYTPDLNNVIQVVDSSPDYIFFLDGEDVYVGSDDYAGAYSKIDGIKASKIINQTISDYSHCAIVITTDGSVAKVYAASENSKPDGGYDMLYPANGDKFHSIYYANEEEFYGDMGGGGYALAVRDSGLYYKSPTGSSWTKVPGNINFPQTSLPGFCTTFAQERFEYDEEKDEERWWLEPYESTIAFCATEDGKGYVLRAQCNDEGTLTGIAVEQLEGSNWQYLPPTINSSETKYVQRGGKIYKMTSSRPSGSVHIQLAFAEVELVNPSGRMIAQFEKNMFFAPSDKAVDMTLSGGTVTVN